MADVYEMMMKIGLSGGILHDLATVADRLNRIHNVTTGIASHFNAWHVALTGVASLLGGAAIVGGVVKLSEGAAKWQEALIKAQQSGIELREMVKSGELQKLTYDMSKRVGMTVEDLISIPTTLFSVTGKEEALRLWEPMARYSSLSLGDKSEADKETALRSLVRAGELTGRFTDKEGNFDNKKANEFLDLVVKIKNATHGMVNEQTMLNFATRAGTSARSLTDQGFIMEAIQMQAMGGHQAGTSLMSLWQQMAGGTMFKRTAEGMQEMGLLKPGEWHVSGGRVILDKDASKRLTGLIGKDPTNLVTAMVDSMAARGVTEPEDQQREIMRMLNRATTQRMMSEMIMNRRQQRAESGRAAGGMGKDDSFQLREEESIKYNTKKLENAWHNLFIAIGGPESENFIKVLQQLTSIIQRMTDFVRGIDPNTMNTIIIGVTGLGVALAALGAVAIVGAAIALAPGGAIAVAIVTLSGILATLVAMNWDAVVNGLNSVKVAVVNFVDWIKSFNPFGSPANATEGTGWRDWLGRDHPGGMSMKPYKRSSFEGGDFANSILPASFDPGEKKQILQPIQLDLNVDGRTLAQCVSEILEDLYTHPSGAPSSNGWNKFRPAGQYSDT